MKNLVYYLPDWITTEERIGFSLTTELDNGRYNDTVIDLGYLFQLNDSEKSSKIEEVSQKNKLYLELNSSESRVLTYYRVKRTYLFGMKVNEEVRIEVI